MAEKKQDDGDVIVLGGRRFGLAQNITFGHHIWMMNHVYAAGLHEPSADTEAFVVRVLASGRVMELLAGSLVERGTTWTPERAAEAGEFFSGLTAPADIQTLQAALLGVLSNFFLRPGSSFATSPSSSTPDESPATGEIAEQSTSATGPSSSESSPDGIPVATTRS